MPQEIIAPDAFTRREWARKLNAMWDDVRRTAVEGFIALGDNLRVAKAQLAQHGHWLPLLQTDLKFGVRIAQQLMSVSRWVEERRITAAQMKLLPPDYNTITLLTRVDELTFKEMVEEGTIRPSLQRDEVAKLLRLRHRQGDEQRVLNLTPVVGKFRTLVIDPAWEYDDDLAGIIRPDYALQGLDNLRALDVGAWVDEQEGCHLYCWATNAFIIEAGKLVAHWGFTHRTVLTWVKPSIGVGRYFRNDTEHVLFATWGDTGTRPAAMSIGTHFEAPRGEHSEKPAAFYDIVRAASFPPYGEANQREPREDFVNLFEEREQQAAAE